MAQHVDHPPVDTRRLRAVELRSSLRLSPLQNHIHVSEMAILRQRQMGANFRVADSPRLGRSRSGRSELPLSEIACLRQSKTRSLGLQLSPQRKVAFSGSDPRILRRVLARRRILR
jgi:hypothetical protein